MGLFLLVCVFLGNVRIQMIVASTLLSCGFFLFFFLIFFICSIRTCWFFYGKQYIYVLFTDPQILLFSKFFIKNGSHGIIYTFKNYFSTVFLVSVFSFSKNKLNPNGLIGDESSLVSSCICLLVGCVFFMEETRWVFFLYNCVLCFTVLNKVLSFYIYKKKKQIKNLKSSFCRWSLNNIICIFYEILCG